MSNMVEFKKDIGFDDIQSGDLIEVRMYDGTNYTTDRRGYAINQTYEKGVWYFSGMAPVYRDKEGQTLHKIMPEKDLLTVEAGEVARLISIEARIKARITEKHQKRYDALMKMRAERDVWQIEDALMWERKAQRYLDEINGLEELLDH